MRHYNLFDHFASALDNTLKTLITPTISKRAVPGDEISESDLNQADKRQSVCLMRVNHAGEIAAQGLYHGQAKTARNAKIAAQMKKNADEETDHLAWCQQRIKALGGRISLLTPFWYAGSFTIGFIAGIAGDRWSLGFVKETEDQVVAHLQSHLSKVPVQDKKTIAIIQQMQQDEYKHAQSAMDAGSYELPDAIKHAMRLSAKVMTHTAYYV